MIVVKLVVMDILKRKCNCNYIWPRTN